MPGINTFVLFCEFAESENTMIQESYYENLFFPDPELPLIFHFDQIQSGTEFVMHWQDSPELLYFTEGRAEVVSDIQKVECQTGDVAWIGSGSLHNVRALTAQCGYHCLIVDREFLEKQGIPAADLSLKLRISDRRFRGYFDTLIHEMEQKGPYYKASVRSQLMEMGVCACRDYQESRREATQAQSRKIRMVKEAIRYLQEHFAQSVTVDEVAAAVGFSKYYFSRGFKEITGRTLVDYLNVIRVSHARRLLASGRFNVSESAERSGFTNLSYFTKTYRRYVGNLPSQEET